MSLDNNQIPGSLTGNGSTLGGLPTLWSKITTVNKFQIRTYRNRKKVKQEESLVFGTLLMLTSQSGDYLADILFQMLWHRNY